MGTLVGIKEGSGRVGLMLALLPWHWLIKDILAKTPSFLSENVTFAYSTSRSLTGALPENTRIEFLRPVR